MGTILWMPCAIYALHTMELILTVFAALLSGFLMKLLFDQFRNGLKASESDELQTELELLQNRFSAEVLRKEEAEKLLKDEVKAADMRNVELQVQYAKALHFVEQLRTGTSVENHELETEDGRQILHNLQDKIARQERSLLELEQQLQQANRSNEELSVLHQQVTDAGAEIKVTAEQNQNEHEKMVLQLKQQLQEKEQLQQQYEASLLVSTNELKQAREQLVLLHQKNEEQTRIEDDLQRLRERVNELQQQEQVSIAVDMNIQKEGITTIRTKAGEVATTIEQFRDHLTTILRDSYSYEQLLASNERLQSSMQKLQDEKYLAEEQLQLLQQLQKEKAILEEQSKSSVAEWQAKEQSWLNQILAFESSILHLKEEIAAKESIREELLRAKEEMKATIDELYCKLDEKERQSKEMLRVVKDIESRFALFYSNNHEAPVIDETGEMQYR